MSFGSIGCGDAGVRPGIQQHQSTGPGSPAASSNPANVNSADPSDNTVKPLQNEDLSLNIRQKLIKSDVSHSVQNIQIATQDGKVVLRGLVKTAEEKQRVQEIAESVAGTPNVENWIEVE